MSPSSYFLTARRADYEALCEKAGVEAEILSEEVGLGVFSDAVVYLQEEMREGYIAVHNAETGWVTHFLDVSPADGVVIYDVHILELPPAPRHTLN